jgi:hypothetical protein
VRLERAFGARNVDVGLTDPRNPVKLGEFGDAEPAPSPFSTGQYHSVHSVQGFTQGNKAHAVMIDNEEASSPATFASTSSPHWQTAQARLLTARDGARVAPAPRDQRRAAQPSPPPGSPRRAER